MTTLEELKNAKVFLGDRMVEIPEELRDRVVAELELFEKLRTAISLALASAGFELSEDITRPNALLNDLRWKPAHG